MREVTSLIVYFLFLFVTGAGLANPSDALIQLEKASFFPFGGVGICGHRQFHRSFV
jgi:hypothetical protein